LFHGNIAWVNEIYFKGEQHLQNDYRIKGREIIHRFGANENIYLSGRYNIVVGDNLAGETVKDIDITKFNINGGWFMANNILAKLEYVLQSCDDCF